ncbi:MAG: GNAT family N-acetyltransferase [Butyrivibrio hungatei]|nr:GNAT family N-acetyltransferase [Butyrivibrio hungatei]
MELRELRDNEMQLLQDFLYEAIFIPEGIEPPAREIIYRPELKIYYENFGEGKADYCIVADDGGRTVGAVWTRIMNDYGHVDDNTPSLAVQKANYAVRMYEKAGFKTMDENGEEYIMVCEL